MLGAMRRSIALTPLLLLGCDLISQATATVVVGGIVAATPEVKYAGFYDVRSEVTANVWLGERASSTSTEAPEPLSGATVSIGVGGKAIRLPETSERGVYATTSVDDASLTYQAGATYTFDAVVTETHGGETVAPARLTAQDLALTPALGGGGVLPNIGTHAQGTALSVTWPTTAGKYGLVTVFRADQSNPSQPALVFDNRPQNAKAVLDLVLGTPPTSLEVPATAFSEPGLYALMLVAADRGELRDNTSIASPLLVGSGAAVLFTVGTP